MKKNGFHLDISANPGSKTTQSASLLKNEGVIIANDPVRTRFPKLIENLDSQKVLNTLPVSLRGEVLHEFFQNFFDTAIVDPPCSSLGRNSHLNWFPKKSKILSIQQEKILRSAFFALKNGGELIYSTCTTRPEENELVIENFLRKFSDKCELVNLREEFEKIIDKKNVETLHTTSLRNENFLEDFSQKKETYKKVRDEIWEKTLSLKDLGEGFFIAKIVKKSESFFKEKEKKIFCNLEDLKETDKKVSFTFNNKKVEIQKNLWEKVEGKFERRNFEK
ncbi:MAG: hypothetical protein Fur0024_4850 [Patescibacteria group bacterium]